MVAFNSFTKKDSLTKVQGVVPVSYGGAMAPQILADQLTLSQPGWQIMPTYLLLAPPDFQTFRRPCKIDDEISTA